LWEGAPSRYRNTTTRLEAEAEDVRVKLGAAVAHAEQLARDVEAAAAREAELLTAATATQRRMRTLEREKAAADEATAAVRGELTAATAASAAVAASRKEATGKLSAASRTATRLQEDNVVLRDKAEQAEAVAAAARVDGDERVKAQERKTLRAETRLRDAERALGDLKSGACAPHYTCVYVRRQEKHTRVCAIRSQRVCQHARRIVAARLMAGAPMEGVGDRQAGRQRSWR
jgi:chromosome segregation ATPase